MPCSAAASSTTPRACPTASAVWTLRLWKMRSTPRSVGACSSIRSRRKEWMASSRSGSVSSAGVWEAPGSVPRTITGSRRPRRSPGDLGQQLLGDLEVARDALHVLEILQVFHEPQVLARLRDIDGRRLLRQHRLLRALDRDPGLLERPPDRLEVPRLAVDLQRIRIRLHVACAGVDGEERHLVRIDAGDRHGNDTSLLELPGHRARDRQLATRLGEDGAHLGGRPVAVVRGGLDEERDAAGTVALVDDLLVLLALAAPGRLLHGALDRVDGRVRGACLLDREAQPEVAVGVAAPGPRRDGDLAPHLGEDGAALDVVDALVALDLGPFGVTGHRAEV